jgi:pimeloyl-ACP methyl ester carboxylesterase
MSVIDGSVGTESGRRVAYAQMGRLDGTPLLYFHGDPGSRLDFDQPLSRAALDESGVRLIGIDRPGFGRSTHQAGRRHRDWPSDVLAVADELGIDRFGILAYSAGGPYAVACALAFPEWLTFVGIVSGIGPAETPRHREGMPRTAVTAIGLSRRVPAVVRWVVKHTSPERFSRQFDKELSPADRMLYRDPHVRQAAIDFFAEATRHGPHGLVEDWRLMGTPSGLDYTAVQCPIRLWHGDADGTVPAHHAKHVARLVPKADLEVLPGVGHLPPPRSLGRVRPFGEGRRWSTLTTLGAGLGRQPEGLGIPGTDGSVNARRRKASRCAPGCTPASARPAAITSAGPACTSGRA